MPRSSSAPCLTRLLLSLTLLATACDSPQKAPTVAAPRPPVGAYADGAAGLQRLWEDILAACKKDDRERVHDLIASLGLSKDELTTLIGPKAATEQWPNYQFQVGSMANGGAVELVAFTYEKKLDEVVVQKTDELPSVQQAATTRAVRERLGPGPTLYTVQLRHKPDPKGLRYEALVYVQGRWRTVAPLARRD